jgi:ribose 5-phosphate isomerase A
LNLNSQEVKEQKRKAALEAVKHIKSGLVVGLGSGSTAAIAIEEIGNKIKREKIHVLGIPTSYQSFMLATKHHIPTTTLEEHPILDVTIDGADQIDGELNLIKGMGGALAREKILAYSSKQNIIVADEGKVVETLGEKDQPVPIEIVPFAIPLVVRRLKIMKGKPVIREGNGKVGPVITDNGNVIADTEFGLIPKPKKLDRELKAIPGVVETGIFVGTASLAYIGKRFTVEKLAKG